MTFKSIVVTANFAQSAHVSGSVSFIGKPAYDWTPLNKPHTDTNVTHGELFSYTIKRKRAAKGDNAAPVAQLVINQKWYRQWPYV